MVRKLTEEQFDDRMEWLQGAAASELAGAAGARVVETLDRIQHAARECAKYLRGEE